ncbi:MAG: hypothetical protein KAJ51_16905, partial [Thermoplasmata archaeon]|nr:hypothetical protein [Thermoplasmata archaeon]
TIPQTAFYYETVVIDGFNKLDLIGGGRDRTFVHAQSAGDCFDVSNTRESVFEGMTLWYGNPYGIEFHDNTNVNITDVNISLCSNDGIYHYYNSPYQERYHISNGTLDAAHPMPVVDSNDNVHIVWVAESPTYWDMDDVWYTMYDSNGNLLIEDTKLTMSDSIRTKRPKMVVDSQDKIHIIWHDYKSHPSQSNAQIHYMKIDPYLDDRDGDPAFEAVITLIDDMPLYDSTYYSTGMDKDMVIDSNDNIHIVFFEWNNYGGFNYIKMDNMGNILFGPTPYLNFMDWDWWRPMPQLGVDSQNDLHIVWADYFSTNYDELHYMKLDGANGNVLINRTQITPTDDEYSKWPTMVIDSNDMVHIIWGDKNVQECELFYMKLDPSKDDQNGDS